MRVAPDQVGRWRFVTLRRSVDSGRDIADLDINLDLMPDKDRTVVRLGLSGSLTVTDKAALDTCLDKYARLFAALSMWDKQSDIAVSAGRRRVRRPRHRRIRGCRGRRIGATAARSDGEGADDARAALALLLRLADRGVA